MRFEELGHRLGGAAVTLPFHRKLTVVSGLTVASRRAMADRIIGCLAGTAPGAGASLLIVDGAGSRIRLVRDPLGGATVTDADTGEDLADEIAPGGHLDWFALLGLDPAAAGELVLLGASPLDRPDDGGELASPAGAELVEAREVLARVAAEYQEVVDARRCADDLRRRVEEFDGHIRNHDEEVARRRHAVAYRAVQRLESELALVSGDTPAERLAAEAAIAAASSAGTWRRTGDALSRASATFGDRRRLDPRSLERALAHPTEVPGPLAERHSAYMAAQRRRTDLLAALDAGTASELPAPSTPWVTALARIEHPELWPRAERVKAARARAAALSMGLGGTGQHRDMVGELEVAHQAVEEAERAVDSARIKPLALAARKRLAKAQEREHAVLTRTGFVSWLAFQMRRIDVLLEPDALEALRLAELEAQVALSAWSELAPDVDPEPALAVAAEIEAYAAEMTARASSVDATEALRRDLAETVEPAWKAARGALIDVIAPFEVEPEHAVSEVAAVVDEARHARLQAVLEAAESDHAETERALDAALTSAGLPGPDSFARRVAVVAERAAAAVIQLETIESNRSPEEIGAELAAARGAFSRVSLPDWDEHPHVSDELLADPATLMEERTAAATEADRIERSLPDTARLADRREALARRVAILEATSGIGPKRLSFEEAEMVLLGRFAAVRRVGPDAEPVPVIIDEALAGFSRHDKWRLLDLLVRLGEASQVVYLTDDVEVADWAAGRAREGSVSLVFPEEVAAVA